MLACAPMWVRMTSSAEDSCMNIQISAVMSLHLTALEHMPSFKLCMNSGMNLSACTHLQQVHHLADQRCHQGHPFFMALLLVMEHVISWSQKLLWELWTLFGLEYKKASQWADFSLNAPHVWVRCCKKSHEYGNHRVGMVSIETMNLWLFQQPLCNCESPPVKHMEFQKKCLQRSKSLLNSLFFHAQKTRSSTWD